MSRWVALLLLLVTLLVGAGLGYRTLHIVEPESGLTVTDNTVLEAPEGWDKCTVFIRRFENGEVGVVTFRATTSSQSPLCNDFDFHPVPIEKTK